MSKTLKTVLWTKFIVVVIMFLISFSLNFVIATMPDSQMGFYLLLFGKPVLILIFILLLNLLFHFPGRINVPAVIPSTFLILSFLVFIDLGYLIFKYYSIFENPSSFWLVYSALFGICIWNFQKYIRAFTVGLPD